MNDTDQIEHAPLKEYLDHHLDVTLIELRHAMQQDGATIELTALIADIANLGYALTELADGRLVIRPGATAEEQTDPDRDAADEPVPDESPEKAGRPESEQSVAAPSSRRVRWNKRNESSKEDSGTSTPPHPKNPVAVVAVTVVALLVLTLAGLYLNRRNAPQSIEALRRPAPAANSDNAGGGPAGSAQAGQAGQGAQGRPTPAGGAVGGRDNRALSSFMGLKNWRWLRGSWTVTEATATVTTQSGGELAIALLPLGAAEANVKVQLPQAEAGSGVIFRAVDPDNYWIAAVDAASSTVIVYHVEQGTARSVGSSERVAITPGMTLGVNASGPTIQVRVDDQVVGAFQDEKPGGGFVGIGTAPGSALTATFEAFVATRASG